MATTFITLVAMRFFTVPQKHLGALLNIADAAGLALFGILGTSKTLEYGVPVSIAPIMGVVTGVVGGMIRDVLTPVTPMVMRGEFYASAVIIGAVLYVIIRAFLPEVLAMCIGMFTIFALRMAALYWQFKFPSLRIKF
ncbi:trimeric intracellular cation channel family protein [Thiolinea disciformis]|uniref:trimeric intracellular cation channel family protein n=1 Tax=Thiolinea disciformis TaxID=125614 RepID=UPI00037E34F4|nr:TRIC cation channel family protein [Thiolinea disciformis]